MKPFIIPILFIFLTLGKVTFAQTNCETITGATLITLSTALHENEFDKVTSLLQTIEANCGETELTMRIRIIQTIVNKQPSDALIKKYQDYKFDNNLIQRFDYVAEKNFETIYNTDKAAFDYVPLNHPIDSLLIIKAKALYNSPNYSLNEKERAIVLLFLDDIQGYFDVLGKTPTVASKIGRIIEEEKYKSKPTFGFHTGYFTPIGHNDVLPSSPIFGFSFMGGFADKFVPELIYKFRIHTNSNPYEFKHNNEIKTIQSSSSHVLGAGLGYKVVDKGKSILLPKINIGYGFIWTGLSESYYTENDYGEEIEEESLKNVGTLHSTIGIAYLYRINRKTYIGVEPNYHFIPYQWNNRLQSPIQSNYASLEISIRF